VRYWRVAGSINMGPSIAGFSLAAKARCCEVLSLSRLTISRRGTGSAQPPSKTKPRCCGSDSGAWARKEQNITEELKRARVI